MRLASIAQARQIDELSQSQYGLAAERLMDSAGQKCFELLRSQYSQQISKGSVLVVCGPGNNGGDGLVVARRLWQSGSRNVIIAESNKTVTKAPAASKASLRDLQMQRCQTLGIPVIRSHEQIPSNVTLVVDAIFGIGLTRDVEDEAAQWIATINALKTTVISLDVPSGLQCDTGQVMGVAVKATVTVTFGIAKPGFFICDGPAHVGKTQVVDIGFPADLVKKIANSIYLFTEKSARRLLPRRTRRGHKATFGKVLVIAGSEAYWGSGILASHAAFRMGAGYVTWASFKKPLPALRSIPEVLLAQVSKKLFSQKFDAVVVGPGLGVSKETANILIQLKRRGFTNVVVDADALTAAVKFKLFPLPASWVLTPHAGELARILNISAEVLERNRLESAIKGAQKTGATMLYKGFRTIVSDGTRSSVMAAGNSALAKAGSGDVLAGFIGALMAQGLPGARAAQLGAYIHGRLSEEFVRSGNHAATLMPSDLFLLLPPLLKTLATKT